MGDGWGLVEVGPVAVSVDGNGYYDLFGVGPVVVVSFNGNGSDGHLLDGATEL